MMVENSPYRYLGEVHSKQDNNHLPKWGVPNESDEQQGGECGWEMDWTSVLMVKAVGSVCLCVHPHLHVSWKYEKKGKIYK